MVSDVLIGGCVVAFIAAPLLDHRATGKWAGWRTWAGAATAWVTLAVLWSSMPWLGRTAAGLLGVGLAHSSWKDFRANRTVSHGSS
jgi:hypothetical protein